MRACALRHGAPRRVDGRARGQAVEARLDAAQGLERGAEGPQRMWSTTEAPKCPYAGETRGLRVARGRRRARLVSYGPPWAHNLDGYHDRLLGGPLGLPGLRYTAPEGVGHKDCRGVVLG
jgi:hypothetical protein